MSDAATDKFVLYSLKVKQEVTQKRRVSNLIGNLLFPIGEKAVNTFLLNLTEDSLSVEGIRYDQWGGLPEEAYTEKYPIGDLINFDVKNQDGKELIEISFKKKGKVKYYSFYRKNDTGDNLALQMKELVEGSKAKLNEKAD
ncbi:MAG TPA: hypothetical protein VHO71_03270 [Caproiciproducens sp.]|nr:hypothetical protein [Caproiciproducens sp.]